ncbi:hypothetical protein pipiens_006351 [Culex pipiens pipiens]|uniref:Uncharacterized protein n=1 Tax=Culex pipiens pipiens TaxID=38569 RepID=A0ABD1DQ86_CULPP
MVEENQANDFAESQLTREVDSSQQCQQITGGFSEFERTMLDTSNVEDYEVYDWEKDCLVLAEIVERHRLTYALSKSGGKTLVAEMLRG